MIGNKKIILALLVAVIALTSLVGCSETAFQEATGKGTINAINAMPASPTVGFLIEERALGSIGYKQSHGAQPFDDLSYTFNFEYRPLGAAAFTRFASQLIDMAADTDYTLVITGAVSAPVLTLWERPQREWSGTETVFEVAFAHLSPALGNVDVYLAATGTLPVLGEERAKVSNGDRTAEIDVESEEVEIIITARDDPTTILYQSYPIILAARLSFTFSIFDADPSIPANISVRAITSDGLNLELPDSNFLPTVRTVHLSLATANIDIFRDMDFTTPIFSDLGFGESSGDVPVPDGAFTYTYTAVGDPGTIIDAEDQLISRGLRSSSYLVGDPLDELTRIFQLDDRRPIETHAKLRFVHAAVNHQTIDLYLATAGSDITDQSPTLPSLPFGFASSLSGTIAGSYDVVLTLPNDKTRLATYSTIDLVNGDVAEVAIIDTVDPLVPDFIETRF